MEKVTAVTGIDYRGFHPETGAPTRLDMIDGVTVVRPETIAEAAASLAKMKDQARTPERMMPDGHSREAWEAHIARLDAWLTRQSRGW